MNDVKNKTGISFLRILKWVVLALSALFILSLTTTFKGHFRNQTTQLWYYTGILLLCCIVIAWYLFRSKNKVSAVISYLKPAVAHLPKPALGFLAVAVLYQIVCLVFSLEVYPFTNVGMFRDAKRMVKYSPELEIAKFYFTDAGTGNNPKVIDIRREHIVFLKQFPKVQADQLFGVRPYDNVSKKSNYEYLSKLLAPYTSNLQVGIHHYNFRTGLDTFYTDKKVVLQKIENLAPHRKPYLP